MHTLFRLKLGPRILVLPTSFHYQSNFVHEHDLPGAIPTCSKRAKTIVTVWRQDVGGNTSVSMDIRCRVAKLAKANYDGHIC
jgi:hypothetical protein